MVINGIDTNDISVVVQGAVDKYITPLCLASIREHLPGAEIILSTWEGTNVEGLDYDQVLLNKDPGNFDFYNVEYSQKSNFHRQLYSTVEGLKRATRKYAIKMRADFALESAGFLKEFNKYPAKNKEYSFFSHKVICCSLYSRNPRIKHSRLCHMLHPADFFFFGFKQDVFDLFDIQDIPYEETLYMTKKYPDQYVLEMCRFVSEQYFWIGFLKKHLPSDVKLPKDREDFTAESVYLTEVTFASNLIILSNDQIGLRCIKTSVIRGDYEPGNCFTHFDWKCLYMRYCRKWYAPYILYRITAGYKNQRYHAINILRDLLKRIRKFAWKTVRPRLSHNELTELKPLYLKLKRAYNRLFTRLGAGAYVESYFNEPVKDIDLSVIVQGAVTQTTQNCLKSIRKVLPKAEVILSTWEGTDVAGLDFDKLVLNPDPGPNGMIRSFPYPHTHNVNRQIVSSRNGIKAASRRYCMKIRSDMMIESDAFLDYYNRYSQFISPESPVSRRIMVEGLLTPVNGLFSVSDWWYFGLKQDVERLFDIPLYTPENIPYFEGERKDDKPRYADTDCQYNPEQYIAYQYLRKNLPAHKGRTFEFDHAYDYSDAARDRYYEFIAGSLLCVECSQSGVTLPKAKRIVNPCRINYNFCFANWRELCDMRRTLPTANDKPRVCREGLRLIDEYKTASKYYDIFDHAAIISNYAKFNSIVSEKANTITKQNLTFIVAGHVNSEIRNNTHMCLIAIRRFFPDSKIVLSTFKDEVGRELDGLYDALVEQTVGRKDKTAEKRKKSNEHLDINHWQDLMHAGLEKSETEYAVCMRSDVLVINDNFLDYYRQWSDILGCADEMYQLFQQRLLCAERGTGDTRTGNRPYSLSAYFQAGLVEDLRLLWDGHHESQGRTYLKSGLPDPEDLGGRYSDEQLLFMPLVREKLDVDIPEYYCDVASEKMVFQSEKVYATNVLTGCDSKLGLIFEGMPGHGHNGLGLNFLLELYLYNIDPNNEQCLSYLKDQYTGQKTAKPHFAAAVMKLSLKMAGCGLGILRDTAKKVIRVIFPAYRVSAGTRDRLMNFEAEEADRFDYLVNRVNELEDIQRRNEAEIKKMRQRQTCGARSRRNGCL